MHATAQLLSFINSLKYLHSDHVSLSKPGMDLGHSIATPVPDIGLQQETVQIREVCKQKSQCTMNPNPAVSHFTAVKS